jgi:hypothetical protein
MWTTEAKSQQLLVSSEGIQNSEFKIQNVLPDGESDLIQNPKSKIPNQEVQNRLPCLNSSSECIHQLTERAIANSPELETLEARIGLLDRRLGLAGESINYAESKLWTNYIPDSFSPNPLNIINPFSWIKNIFGGGDIQRSRIAIADLELKKANVEAQRAELERRYSEVESQTREEILTLVLDYEAAGRQATLIATQLNNHQVIFKVVEIEYRMGGSSTNSYLAAIEKQERLENQFIQTQIAQQESLRKILSLTGFTTF